MRVNIHSFFLFSTVPSFLRREINQNALQINFFFSMFTIDLFSKLSKREVDRIATHDDRQGAPFFAGAGWLTTRLIGCCTIYATADESKRCSKKGSNSTEIYRSGYSESGLLEARGGWVENKDGTGWIRHLHTSILNKQWLPGIPFPRRTTQSRVRAHWKRVINATVLSRYRNARNESPSPSVIIFGIDPRKRVKIRANFRLVPIFIMEIRSNRISVSFLLVNGSLSVYVSCWL